MRDKGKYAVLFYEKVVWKDRKFPYNTVQTC